MKEYEILLSADYDGLYTEVRMMLTDSELDTIKKLSALVHERANRFYPVLLDVYEVKKD